MIEAKSLLKAIRDLHGCKASHSGFRAVREVFEGKVVWEGHVEIFDLEGHPEASECYAWSHAVEGSDKRRYVAVLKVGKVDSPAAAVRAALVQESREKED